MNVDDIVRAYADERLAVPLTEIERRAGRRPRQRWAYAAVAVATALIAVVGTVAGVRATRPEPEPFGGQPPAVAFDPVAFGQLCTASGLEALRGTAGLSDADRNTMPPQTFRLRDGDPALWVYAGPRTIIACQPDGVVTYHPPAGAAWPDGVGPIVSNPDRPPLSWVVGQVPAGTERVQAILRSGRVVEAEVAGSFYAAAWTGEAGLPSKIIASSADRIYTHEGGTTTSRPR